MRGEDVAVDAADRCSSAPDRVRLTEGRRRLAADRVRPSPCIGSLEKVVVRSSPCLFLVADDLFVDDEDLFVKKEAMVRTEADLVSSSTCL
jgi:hypothetical protein